ncbi:MAG: Fic family protein [Deltaproteobacteria bacterium]|nr:Fic family protein [Deltaproteobacteria bacterium]
MVLEKRLDSQLRSVLPPSWPALLAGISEIDESKGWWRGKFQPPPSWLAGLRKRTIAQSAKASIGIDWVGFPRRGVGTALAMTPAQAEELRRYSAAGYAQILKAIFDGREQRPLSRELLLEFHTGLLRYSPGDRGHRGAYRTLPDRSAFFPRRSMESIALRPSEPDSIEREMDALIAWTNARLNAGKFHPLFVVAGFLLEFLAIRPFAGGNGRTSRLLTNLLLLRSGYSYLPYASLEKAIAERKAEYYLALRKSQASRHLPPTDMGPWLTAFLDAMRAQARELKGLLAGHPPESRLSGNQARVLALLVRHREITNRMVSGELRISRETAKQVLNRLVALNLLTRTGAGRAVRYRRAEPT